MNSVQIQKYETIAAEIFRPTADYIATSAAGAVCSVLQNFDFESLQHLSPAERASLAAFVFPREVVEQIQRLIERDFLKRAMGFQHLFEKAHRLAAQHALRTSMGRYSRFGSLSEADCYEQRYQPLFKALHLSYHSLLFIDGNLFNYLTYSPERSTLLRRYRRRDADKSAPA